MADLRDDPVTFAKQVLGVTIWPHQQGPLCSRARNVTIAGGRRSGKSATAQVKAIHVASTRRDVQVLCVLPAIDAGRSWLREAADILRASKLRDSVVDEQAQSIKFSTGSEIVVLPATAGQLRGRGRNLLLVILEEAGFQDSTVVRDISYALLDNYDEGAQLWQVGSPWGPPQHPFRVAYERGLESGNDEDYASFTVRTTDNPRLPKDFIERERARLAPSEAAAELDGEWSEAVGSLFSRKLLEAHTAPITVPSMSELVGPASPIMGVDYGVSFDRSAAVFLYRLPVSELNPEWEYKPRFIALPYIWAAGAPTNDVVDELVNCAARPCYIAPEVNGVGSYPSEELTRRIKMRPDKWPRSFHYVNTTAPLKTTGYSCILALMERGQLVLPNDPDLLRQLAGLRFEQGARGFLKIEAEQAAVHDDAADALYLASLPYSAGKGKVACGLAQLAGPKAPKDARMPPMDSEIIQTGDGLNVHQQPTLQGVRDRQITPYADQRPVLVANEERIGKFTIKR